MNQHAEKIIAILAFFAIAIPILIGLGFTLKLALYSRRLKQKVEARTMVGLVGRAESEIVNEGMVFVRGELWPAHACAHIPRGARVRVTGFKYLALEVEALKELQN
jgi:membrane-bound ClpP family serine protease